MAGDQLPEHMGYGTGNHGFWAALLAAMVALTVAEAAPRRIGWQVGTGH